MVEALRGGMDGGGVAGGLVFALPARIRFQRELIADWMPDPVTLGVVALLPDWVHWLGERAGLPADRMQPLLDAARETPAATGRQRTL